MQKRDSTTMSASIANPAAHVAGTNGTDASANETDDIFTTSSTQAQHPRPHRYSSFDTQLFASGNLTSSPTQVKRALEAHLAETERRLQEASKLGTSLVQQRQDLADRLKDVEKQQQEGEIGPELRQKLANIEKEYNEVGRETTRAFLGSKSRVPLSEEGADASFAINGRVGSLLGRCAFRVS